MKIAQIHPVKYLFISCLTLSLLRISIEWDMIYLFLLWNLFLAWVPYAIAQNLVHVKSKVTYLAALAIVLLFIPNASYLITDFVHFRQGSRINLWFDLVLFFTYAFTGLMLMMYTIDILAKSISIRIGQRTAQTFKFSIFPIIGCGIYVGRIERWNSWDVFVHPFSFVSDMLQIIFSPQITEFIWFSMLFGGFCAMFYLFLKLHQSNDSAIQTEAPPK